MARDPLILQFLLLLALMFVNSFFTCAEVALISLNKNRLEKMSAESSGPGHRQASRAKRILSLISQPAKFIASVQVAITLAGFLSSAFAADNFSGRLTQWLVSRGTAIPINALSTISLVGITLILSFFTIVLCELLPKRIALKKAETLAFASSGIVLFASRIFAPVVWILTKTTNGILRIIGFSTETSPEEITEEEIRLMIDVGSAKGTIKSVEKEILHNVFEFDNKTAGEVMTHRRDVTFLNLVDSDEEWERIITEKRYGNYPVCRNGPDDITGVLNTRDYLVLKDRSRGAALAQALRPARFVPLSVRTDILFRQMKTRRNHFCIAVDEHGSMMGIVTMNDLLEELVGDLENDSDAPPEKPLLEFIESNVWYIAGAAPLDKVNRELGIDLPANKYDTFTGFAFSLLGRIPEDGQCKEQDAEELEFAEQGIPWKLAIKILEVRERRLEKALVKKMPA